MRNEQNDKLCNELYEIVSDFTEKINAIEREQLGKTVQAYRFLKAEKRGLNEECVLIPEWVPHHLAYIESIEEVEDIEDYATELRALKEIRRWEKRFGLKELIKSLQEALDGGEKNEKKD